MANINEILARAASLRDETALNSISPERAGGIMYDTLLALNELWLQQGSALVISKIYASVAAMEADTAPVSDLTGKPLRPGQIVVIASSDSDNGSVYRYNGTESPSWSLVGSIGNLDPVDSLDSDSTTLPLAAHQGKVLDDKISQLGQEVQAEAAFYGALNSFEGTITEGKFISNYGVLETSSAYNIMTFSLKRGEFFVGFFLASSSVSAIALDNGSTYSIIKIGESGDTIKYYTYLAQDNVDLVISYRPTYEHLFYKSKSDVTNLLTLINPIEIDADSWERGKYISSSGSVESNANYSYGIVSLNKGDCVLLECAASSSISAISIVNGGTFTPVVIGEDVSNKKIYKYLALNNCTIAVCGRYYSDHSYDIHIYKTSGNPVFASSEDLNNNVKRIDGEMEPLFERKAVSPTLTSGSYVSYEGEVTSTASYSMTSDIELSEGETIVVKCSAGSGCATIAEHDTEASLYRVVTTGSGDMDYYNFTAIRATKVVLSFRNTYEYEIYVSKKTTYSEFLIKNKYDQYKDYIKFLNKILFIGDSVTAGAVADYPRTTGAIAEDVPSMSCPVQFENITGVDCVNGGVSGYSPKNWYDNKIDDYTYTDYNLCLIELGYNGGLEDTLDTDVIPYEDYNDYADSACGNYCKIIGAIQEANPSIMIVLVISPNDSAHPEMPATIKRIASIFNLPFIDLRPNLFENLNDNKFHGFVSGGSRDMIHFNPIGYRAKAIMIQYLLSNVLYQNMGALNNCVPLPTI